MGDNQLSSFMMLNEHLYEVFAHYIHNGRNRAPPENELIEMLPTFQFGAKTDRRALQSKFKSWAKRMNYENGYLMLANTGKIIVPKEKCDDLIMHFHSAEHHDVENVIAQIRMTYSWTRKNFGMDRDVVIESLMRNCKKEDCHKKMRMEIARLSNSLCSSVPNSQVPEFIPGMSFGMPPSLPCLPPYHYPIPLPLPNVFPSNSFPFQIPFFNGMCVMGNPAASVCNEIMDDRKPVLNSENIRNVEVQPKDETVTSRGNILPDNSNVVAIVSALKFKKPKNIYEYKSLMEAVRYKPKEFPKILRNEKTQFLSTLGIAPKIVCSSRTLRKFRKELRSKQFMNRECMIYRDRKILRDRNKLKKCSDQKIRHCYLGIPIHKDSTSIFQRKISNVIQENKQSQFFKASRKLNREQKGLCSNKKKIKTSHSERRKPIEIINIASSDEETSRECILPPKEKTEDKEETNEINSVQVQSETIPNTPLLETKAEQTFDIENGAKISDENNNQDVSLKNEKKKYLTQASQRDLTLIQNIRNKILNAKRVLLPKNLNNPMLSELVSRSNIHAAEGHASDSQPVALDAGHKYTMVKHSANYLIPQMNPIPVAIRQTTSSLMQPQSNFAASKQNNVPRIVYPIPVSKTSTSSRLLLVDKEQKGAFFIVPQHSKPIYQQTFPRTQSQVALDPKVLKIHMPVLSSASQLQHLKLKNTEGESMFCGKLFRREDKSKVDINEEMMRITSWIYRMKANLNPSMFTHGIEKSVQKLLSQLDIGIYLVREAKKSLLEIENFLDISSSSTEVAE